jgi:hypothetical protein
VLLTLLPERYLNQIIEFFAGRIFCLPHVPEKGKLSAVQLYPSIRGCYFPKECILIESRDLVLSNSCFIIGGWRVRSSALGQSVVIEVFRCYPHSRSHVTCTAGNTLKVTVFWAVAPYSLVEVYGRFRGVCFLHLQGERC